MNLTEYIKTAGFWMLLLLPGLYLLYFLLSVVSSVYTLNYIKTNTESPPDNSIPAPVVFSLTQFIRPAYIDSRNIYQAFRDCVELDSALIYKPRDNSECRFNNLEFSITLLHKKGIRWYAGKQTGHSFDRKILVLGDSHAMGWGVEGHETFSAILESRLGNVRVDNMAVSSYGLPRELMLMKQVFERETYDLVVIQYCDNDLREIEHYVENNGISYDYVIPAQSPRPQEQLVNNFYVQLAKRIAWFPVEGLEGPRKHDVPEPASKVARVLSDFVDVGKSLPIVIFPVNNIREYETTSEYSYLKEAVEYLSPALRNRISVIDPLSELSYKQRLTHYFQIDGHLNALGHQYLADFLLPVLEKRLSRSIRNSD